MQAASGILSGDIILWTPPLATEGSGLGSRRVAKIIPIHSSPITSLSCVDRFLVSGAADGYVRFFDNRLRLVAWFEVSFRLSLPACLTKLFVWCCVVFYGGMLMCKWPTSNQHVSAACVGTSVTRTRIAALPCLLCHHCQHLCCL